MFPGINTPRSRLPDPPVYKPLREVISDSMDEVMSRDPYMIEYWAKHHHGSFAHVGVPRSVNCWTAGADPIPLVFATYRRILEVLDISTIKYPIRTMKYIERAIAILELLPKTITLDGIRKFMHEYPILDHLYQMSRQDPNPFMDKLYVIYEFYGIVRDIGDTGHTPRLITALNRFTSPPAIPFTEPSAEIITCSSTTISITENGAPLSKDTLSSPEQHHYKVHRSVIRYP